MVDCVFCDSFGGKASASFVYSDAVSAAVMDIQPVNPGHVLIIPKVHASYLSKLSLETGAHLFKVAMKVAAAIRRSGVKCEGINFYLADGESAGQEIFHVHLHVFPRFFGDGFGLKFGPNYTLRPDRSALDMVAKKISEAMP